MILGDTICAPATPPVNSSIAVIRVSGQLSMPVIATIFSKKDKITPRYAYYGYISDDDHIIDDVILVYFKAPGSYTGEDMVEIFCHGNQLIVNRILKLLHRHGIRMAHPGEFSKIAFLNGKMDLTEAEALNHLVTAKSEWEINTAIEQMHGSLKSALSYIRDTIVEMKADIECGIDFIDEGIEFISIETALQKASYVNSLIDDIIMKCKIGEKLTHGIDITITGKPNVGKSSILNLLLNRERAIVSEFPGTTRDVIREPLQIGGIHFNIIDTAGIDTPSNEIERKGMELSLKNIETSQLVLMVFDASTGIDRSDEAILKNLVDKNCIFLINKIDIVKYGAIEQVAKCIHDEPVKFSATKGIGLKDFEEKILSFIQRTFVNATHSYVADMRIINLLEKSRNQINTIATLFKNSEPVEILAFELQTLLDTLTEIVGEITPENVLDSIFSRFCIGK